MPLMPSLRAVCSPPQKHVATQGTGCLVVRLALSVLSVDHLRAVCVALASERVKVVVRLRPPFPHETGGGVVVNKEQSSISVFRE